MAVLLDQETFTKPGKGRVAHDDALVLHRHPDASGVRALTLLVHGWGGTRYSTWRNLPRFLFEDFPDMDVALYDYVSGLRRVRRTHSESLRSTIDHLADTLRDIDHYDRGYEEVFLLAHSMGGVFTQAAVLRLLEGEPAGRQDSVLRRLRAGCSCSLCPGPARSCCRPSRRGSEMPGCCASTIRRPPPSRRVSPTG
ncbi:alpha/beta fold hydrolase [Streptomyces sp. NPDC054962]